MSTVKESQFVIKLVGYQDIVCLCREHYEEFTHNFNRNEYTLYNPPYEHAPCAVCTRESKKLLPKKEASLAPKSKTKPKPALSAGYLALCNQVEEHSPAAADWMRKEAPYLKSFHDRDYLLGCFNWSSTPQGQAFWLDLSTRPEKKPHLVGPPAPTLTMADLRRDCFPASYTWWLQQPEKVPVTPPPESKEAALFRLLSKIMPKKEG